MNVSKAAAFYGVSRSTVYRWIRSGKVQARKKGRRWVVSVPSPEPAAPVAWHAQVNRRYAREDGLAPEDFQFEQWSVSNVRMRMTKPGESSRVDMVYRCEMPKETPVDNQYVQEESGWRKLPDPVGICLSSLQFYLRNADTGELLDEDSRPLMIESKGQITGFLAGRSKLWDRLTPGSSLRVRLSAIPMFYYLNKDGGVQAQYAMMNNGYFSGVEKESRVYVLSLDNLGEELHIDR